MTEVACVLPDHVQYHLAQRDGRAINRLHRLLPELLPGGAKKFLFARQAPDERIVEGNAEPG